MALYFHLNQPHQNYRRRFWLVEERNQKLSWARAPSRLPPNCHLCSLSLLRDNNRFVCSYQFLSWCPCAARWGGRRCSRRSSTTIPRLEMLHNSGRSIHLCLGPWSEVRRRVRLFLFIFWLSPRAEFRPIVVPHCIIEGGEGGVEPSHRQSVAVSWANLRLNWFRHYSIITVTVICVRLYVVIITIIASPISSSTSLCLSQVDSNRWKWNHWSTNLSLFDPKRAFCSWCISTSVVNPYNEVVQTFWW